MPWDSGRGRWRRYAGVEHYRRPAPYKDEGWLREQYVDLRRTVDEIAAESGVAQSSVLKQMRKFGIERRSRSESRIGRHLAETNPSWKGGVSPERQRLYRSSAWKQIVRQVMERDGGRCMRCGDDGSGEARLNTHHLRSWKDHPGERMSVENIVVVCEPCHDWIHSRANVGRELLG